MYIALFGEFKVYRSGNAGRRFISINKISLRSFHHHTKILGVTMLGYVCIDI